MHRGFCGDLTLEPLESELIVGGLVFEGFEGPVELGAFQVQPVILLAEVFGVVGTRCRALHFQSAWWNVARERCAGERGRVISARKSRSVRNSTCQIRPPNPKRGFRLLQRGLRRRWGQQRWMVGMARNLGGVASYCQWQAGDSL